MKQSLSLNNVYVLASSTSAGPLEKDGPLGKYFSQTYQTQYAGEKTYEDAEKKMLKDACSSLMNNKSIHGVVDMMFGGDLSNQITVANYLASLYKIPFIGVYGACSTSVLSMIVASSYIETKLIKGALCFTSSHNCTAERQFRYPTEYGVQRKFTSTWTATGAGAIVLSNKKTDIKVTKFTVGKVIDWGYMDVNDMGSVMAPAAYDTLKVHLEDFNITPNYYDLILTGDLSSVGREIFISLLKKDGIELTNHNDCGLMLYDTKEQKVNSGGSGAACSALVTFSYILDKLSKKELRKVLLIATGALHSSTSVQQKNSIPAIAHAIALEVQ